MAAWIGSDSGWTRLADDAERRGGFVLSLVAAEPFLDLRRFFLLDVRFDARREANEPWRLSGSERDVEIVFASSSSSSSSSSFVLLRKLAKRRVMTASSPSLSAFSETLFLRRRVVVPFD